MFREFLKRQSHVFHIQLWPDRIKISEMNTSRFVEDAPLIALEVKDAKTIVKDIGQSAELLGVLDNVTVVNPFFGDGYVLSDIDGGVAVINHHLRLLIKELPGKIFSHLIIFQPMLAAEKGLSIECEDTSELLSKKCAARNVIIMEPDEYIDLQGSEEPG